MKEDGVMCYGSAHITGGKLADICGTEIVAGKQCEKISRILQSVPNRT